MQTIVFQQIAFHCTSYLTPPRTSLHFIPHFTLYFTSLHTSLHLIFPLHLISPFYFILHFTSYLTSPHISNSLHFSILLHTSLHFILHFIFYFTSYPSSIKLTAIPSQIIPFSIEKPPNISNVINHDEYKLCQSLQWCRKGVCVPYGNDGPKPSDGGWSGFTPWSACSRSCGVGITFKERFCNSPR